MGFPALLTPGRFQPAASWLRAPARGSLQTDGSTGSAPAATGLLLVVVLFAGGGCAFGAEDYAVTERVPIVGESTVGLIDSTNERFEVVAQGLPKQGITHPGQVELTARSAALALAQSGFLRLFDSIRVRSGLTVGQAGRSRGDESVRDSFLRHSRLTTQREEWDVTAHVFWVVGVREVFLAQLRPLLLACMPPLPGATQTPRSLARRPLDPAAASSLVIDVRGLGARPCLFPALASEDRRVLWDSAAQVQTQAPGPATRVLWVADPRSSPVRQGRSLRDVDATPPGSRGGRSAVGRSSGARHCAGRTPGDA